jgi:NADH dehydrogenase [ubiquinone] 1 alpha subcomplex assembly factor 1
MARSTGSPLARPSGRCSRLVDRLVDFADADATTHWRAIDDVVMGGVSHSTLQRYSPGIARFGGCVSLQHGGGFASVRTEPRKWATAGVHAFVIRCRGDGRQYKFTARTDDGFDGVQYQARFHPLRAEWSEVALPVASFVASLRGRPVPGADPLDPARIRQLGFMVSDKQAGPFELLLEWIDAAP